MRNEAREIEAADAYHESMHAEPEAEPHDIEALLDALLCFAVPTSTVVWADDVPGSHMALTIWAERNRHLVTIEPLYGVRGLFVRRTRDKQWLLTMYLASVVEVVR